MGLLRFFLAYTVLISHCLLPYCTPGYILTKVFHPALAVQCFFIISGFYMQLLMDKKFSDQQPGKFYKSFYLSRSLRIFPIYLLTLAIHYVYIRQGSIDGLIQNTDILGSLVYIFSNLLILGQSFLRVFTYDMSLQQFFFYDRLNLLDSRATMSVLEQSWSLDIELLFYILTPFLLTKKIHIVLIVFFLSIVFRFIGALNGYTYTLSYSWIYEFFPFEIATFLLGAISYRIYYFTKYKMKSISNKLIKENPVVRNNQFYIYIHSYYNKISKYINIRKTFILLTYLYLSHYIITYYLKNPFRFNMGGGWGDGLFGVPNSYWYCLLVTAIAVPILFDFSKNYKFDTFIGNLSYPLYICHFTVIGFLNKLNIDKEVFSIYVLTISTAISILLVIFVDNKITKYRHKRFYK